MRLGYTREELLQLKIDDISPSSFPADRIEASIRELKKGGSRVFEATHVRKDGTEMPVEISSRIIRYGDRKVVVSFVRDITERKQTEEKIRLLQTITQAVSDSQDYRSALEISLQKVCKATGWSYGEAWIPRSDGTVLECGPIWYGNNKGLKKFMLVSEKTTFPLDTGLPGRIWSSKQPEWLQDVSSEPETVFLRASAAIEAGLKAGFGVPITINDEVLTVLIFFMFKSRKKDKRLVELVSAVAMQLGSVVQRKRAEEAIQKAHDEMELQIKERTAELMATNEQLQREITERKQTEEALQESENKFRDLAEKSLVGVFLIQDESFKYINPRLAAIFGYTVEEFMDKNPIDMVLPEDKQIVGENHRKKVSGEVESTQYNWRGITKDKRVIYIEVYGSRTIYQGRPAVIGTVLDITKRKRAEEALKDSREKYRTLIENSFDCICHIDLKGNFIYMNPGGVKLNELESFEDVSGRHCTTGIKEGYKGLMNDALERAGKGMTTAVEYESTTANGKELWWESIVSPIKDDNGKVISLVRISRDITERKRAEDEIKRQVDELEEFRHITVGRELKMIELEKEIKRLKEELERARGDS